MLDLQAQLDKRLAELKKPGSKQDSAARRAQIKVALQESGILSKSGKVRKLQTV